MGKFLDRFLEKLESRWSLAALLWQTAGALLSFGIPAWFAHATAWLNAYGPIAWVASGLIGLLVFAAFLLLVAAFRDRIISASIKRRFYEQPDRVNPLETTFRNQRIELANLVSPMDKVIRGKTFIDCEILGPALIIFRATRPGGGSANGVGFIDCMAAVVKNNNPVSGVIFLEDCSLLRGKVYLCTILCPLAEYEGMYAQMPNINWITLTPPGFTPRDLPPAGDNGAIKFQTA